MSREIKFRAWVDTPDCRLSENGYLGAFMATEIDDIDFKHDKIYFNSGLSVKLSEVTLLQYTGLKDKKGIKIFEGDIARDASTSGTVTRVMYSEESAQYLKEATTKTGIKWYCRIQSQDEVIGNTYENSELLKEVK